MIQKKIESLRPYFRGIRVSDNFNITEFNIKKNWVIREEEGMEIEQKQIKDSNDIVYTMIFSSSKTIDEILDYVQSNIINFNIEIEEKENLLKMKIEELKRVFEDKSLDELNNLKFITEEKNFILNKNGITKELPTNA